MAIYYKIVFGLLLSQITFFTGLMIPLPNELKQKSLVFIRDNIISKVQYTLKIVGIFVFILLVDSVNNLMMALDKTEDPENHTDVRLSSAINVKKFYAQRNVYLTGATIFTSFILNYTLDLIIELLSLKDELKTVELKSPNGSNLSQQFDEQVSEIDRLSKEIIEVNEKVSEFEALKVKTQEQQAEYTKLQAEVKKLKSNA